MTRRYGWTLVCPECYAKPGRYFGVFKAPGEAISSSVKPNMECPNCGTRLVDVESLRHTEYPASQKSSVRASPPS